MKSFSVSSKFSEDSCNHRIKPPMRSQSAPIQSAHDPATARSARTPSGATLCIIRCLSTFVSLFSSAHKNAGPEISKNPASMGADRRPSLGRSGGYVSQHYLW